MACGLVKTRSLRLCRDNPMTVEDRNASSDHRQLSTVDSTDRCNTFVEHLSRSSVPQGLPGPLVEFSCNRIQLLLRAARDVNALGQVLPE